MENKIKMWRDPRGIVKRIIVRGNLVMQTAAHFGGGEVDPFGQVDMTLLQDPLDQTPLLPGASIAGALRSYLQQRTAGFRTRETDDATSVALFGMRKKADVGEDDLQSGLIVDDSIATEASAIELRDGVKIDVKTRTAEDKAKYDLEVLAAGATFPLRLELVVQTEKGAAEADLRAALATALQGLQAGEIHLGAKKNRGLGKTRVDTWTVAEYDLTQPQGMFDWLASDNDDLGAAAEPRSGGDIAALLGVMPPGDKRRYLHLRADFSLVGGLLVGSGFGNDRSAPDAIQLVTRQENGESMPVVPGTSLTGVIRHRALRIANTLGLPDAQNMVDIMFGYHHKEKDEAKMESSRVRVRDAMVENTTDLVQNRVRIDRFTGGALETGLFSEQPVYGKEDSRLTLDLLLENPDDDAEIGLLLQVLKDLWVGDLPVGGTSSIGRGRLQGVSAKITLNDPSGEPEEWTLERAGTDDGSLTISGDRQRLNDFAQALAKKGADA